MRGRQFDTATYIYVYIRHHESIHSINTIHTTQIEREVELDPTRQYIFGWHPHGILLLSRFAIYGGLWDKLFPGIRFKVRACFSCTNGLLHPPTTVVRVNDSIGLWMAIFPSHHKPQRRRHHRPWRPPPSSGCPPSARCPSSWGPSTRAGRLLPRYAE